MLMQAKNAVGFNTPGAASSAADLEAQEASKSSPKLEKIDTMFYIINYKFLEFMRRFMRSPLEFMRRFMREVYAEVYAVAHRCGELPLR